MEAIVANDSSPNADLLRRAAAGDHVALNQLLSAHRDGLKRMIRLRLNRRLQGRLDASDVLQEAYLEIARRMQEYLQNPAAPFYLWLRKMVGLKLAEVHRRHLGTQMRDADRDLSIYHGALPAANSLTLAAQLLGQLTTPSEAAVKAEMQIRLQQVLESIDPVDREIIALRHFEQLNSEETAEVLGMSKSGASSRYIRALKRLRAMLEQFPEFREL